MKRIAALRASHARPKLPLLVSSPHRGGIAPRAAALALALSAALVSSVALAQTPPSAPAKATAPSQQAAPSNSPSAPNPADASSTTTATPSAPPPVGSAPAASVPPPYPAAPAADATPDTAAPVDTAASDNATPASAVPAPEVPPPAPAASSADAIYEPPLPRRAPSDGPEAVPEEGTPLPPPPVKHVAPRASLWVGARPGIFVPMGAMWLDGEPIGSVCCSETVRPFSEFAGPGPSLSVDVGVRFARHYQGFAFWERGWLSSGALENEFGGQNGAATSMFGGGFRFSTHPDAIGMIVEIAIGYRTFEADWENGTRLTAADDLFSTRLGFGAEWRINRLTTLELLLVVGGGAFTDVEWQFADGTKRNALTGYDRFGQYIPFGVQIASHWDVISSDD